MDAALSCERKSVSARHPDEATWEPRVLRRYDLITSASGLVLVTYTITNRHISDRRLLSFVI